MLRKIGILILIGIISMYTVIPMALADNNDDVYENPGCSIEVEEPPTCEDGVVFTLNATVTGGTPGTGYTYSWDDGGIGGTFDPSDSVEDPTWTPPAGFTGTATLKLEVTDDKGCTTECDVDVTEIEDEKNIFTIIWDKLTLMLSFFKNGEETTIDVDVAGKHPSGKVNHGAIVSLIAKIINKSKSVVGKTHGLIMRTVAKTNWGKKIKENDSSDSVEDLGKKGKPEKGKKPNKGKKPDVIPPKKGF